MLKLRVQIPDIGKEYDVQCNEKAYVEDVIQDILDLICRKESLQVEKEEKLAVYSVQKGRFLKKSYEPYITQPRPLHFIPHVVHHPCSPFLTTLS